MRLRSLLASLLCSAAFALSARAENLSDLPLSDAGPAVDHGDADVGDALRSPDPDRVDTALVFTNPGLLPTPVRCVAFDRAGEVVGHGHALVPGRGTRFVLASDLVDRDFAGHVQCGTPGRLLGSAFLRTPGGVTDAPARQSDRPGRGDLRIVFPAVAHF